MTSPEDEDDEEYPVEPPQRVATQEELNKKYGWNR